MPKTTLNPTIAGVRTYTADDPVIISAAATNNVGGVAILSEEITVSRDGAGCL